VPGVAAAVQDQGEFGEPGGLGDHQPVQADELIGVEVPAAAAPPLLRGLPVTPSRAAISAQLYPSLVPQASDPWRLTDGESVS
jgi:hypothetical protein